MHEHQLVLKFCRTELQGCLPETSQVTVFNQKFLVRKHNAQHSQKIDFLSALLSLDNEDIVISVHTQSNCMSRKATKNEQPQHAGFLLLQFRPIIY